ncbi:MAG TPA: N-6 DNA methylase, partial [Methanocorpusculum sp.]|nr:N-6 DNA methylase [Methanocorpusculum sp.]
MALISEGTRRNWKKLNSTAGDEKLCFRANKQLSRKKIIPYEYLDHKSNRPLLDTIIRVIEENKVALKDILHSLAVIQLINHGLPIDDKENLAYQLLHDYGGRFNNIFRNIKIPDDEHDFLGIVYQSLLLEGNKNETGSYYTPLRIAKDMLAGYKFEHGEMLYDPCCGSGSILLAADVQDYRQLYGSDIDKHALFICKVNLLSKYPDADEFSRITLTDFLLQYKHEEFSDKNNAKYDYIVTNPPWGSKVIKASYCHPAVPSGESASMFAIESCTKLKSTGSCSFLVPKSLMNITVHRDFRKYL